MVKKKIETKSEEILSEQEVWDVLKFAQELGYNNSILNPMLVSQRMKEITLNPVAATEYSLSQAMADPKNSELALLSFSEDFEIQSQAYKKLISYLGNMLSYDFSYECINISRGEYSGKPYQKDLDIFKKFMDGFDFKDAFTRSTNEMLRNEAVFYCPREDAGGRMVLQELPSSPVYTMITGRGVDCGLLFDFNLMWFLNPGVDLKMYPKFFSDKYKNLWGDGKTLQSYVPSLPPELRGSSSWVYWQSVPIDVGWCFKFNPTMATRAPYFSGLFLDLIQQPLMRALQKNINVSVASRMIIGQVGTLKDAQSKVKDQFAINPETLGKFMALIKAAVGDSLKVASAPLENMQKVEFSESNEVYNSFLKTALATGASNSNLIFPLDTRANTIESQLALNNDEFLMASLYPQYQNFLNYQINKRTSKFKFKVHLEGTQYYNNRDQRLEKQMTLLGNGIVMPGKIAAAIGMSPFEFQRNLEESQALGWTDKLTPITPAAQMPGDAKKGRPSKSDSDLSDSGAQTRGDGGNIAKGGKK